MEPVAIQLSRTDLEILRMEMTAAGDRLHVALTAENQFDRPNRGEDLADLKERWGECRRIVDQLANDYATATQRWRSAVRDNVASVPIERAGRITLWTLLRQLLRNGLQRMGVPWQR